jgi:hypothetical protein
MVMWLLGVGRRILEKVLQLDFGIYSKGCLEQFHKNKIIFEIT